MRDPFENLLVTVLHELGNDKPSQKQIELTRKLISGVMIYQPLSIVGQLTHQEKNCLLLAAKGLTSNEIAEMLKIKKTTVETHRKKILRKLSCSNLTQAVFKSIQFGYINN